MAALVDFNVKGELIENLLEQCGLEKNFFDLLTDGYGSPFGDDEFGCDSLSFGFHLTSNLADSLYRILDRLLSNVSSKRYNADAFSEKSDCIKKLMNLIASNKENINKYTTAKLKRGFCYGSDGAGYEELSMDQGKGEFVQAEADNINTFNWTLAAEDLWWDDFYQGYVETPEFKQYEESRIPNEAFASAKDQYWEELLNGEHPEYFQNRELSPATKLLRFTIECPMSPAELDFCEYESHEIIGEYDIPMLSDWARYCGTVNKIDLGNE